MGRATRNALGSEHWANCVRQNMETAAWRSLTPYAQALYPWLKLEWRGPKANNNGRIKFSVRQAGRALGINPKTAAKAMQNLQAKGFLVMTEPARLGGDGQGQAPSWEITEIALPQSVPSRPRNLFRRWSEGKDFPVHRAKPQNPKGKNGSTKIIPMKVVN